MREEETKKKENLSLRSGRVRLLPSFLQGKKWWRRWVEELAGMDGEGRGCGSELRWIRPWLPLMHTAPRRCAGALKRHKLDAGKPTKGNELTHLTRSPLLSSE